MKKTNKKVSRKPGDPETEALVYKLAEKLRAKHGR